MTRNQAFHRSVLSLRNLALVAIITLPSLEAQSYEKFANRWKPDQYLYLQNGVPVAGAVSGNSQAAMWSFVNMAENYVQIMNRQTNEYLHVERGRLESSPIQQGWWSAQWTIEHVGGGFSRFKNRWTGNYLHIERGFLDCGAIEDGWWSAQWKIQRWTVPARTYTTSTPGYIVDRRPQNKTITFRNEGGYVARYALGYYTGNQPRVERTNTLAVGQSESFEVPEGAEDFEFKGEYNNAFSWKTIFKLVPGEAGKVMDPGTGQVCIKTWGTVFSPQWGRCN